MKNITIIILTLIFLSHCGYTTVYKNQKSIDFGVNITKTTGDNEINNLIKNEIKLYSNNVSQRIYNTTIILIIKKKVLTKNTSGSITDYNLSVTSSFTINLKNGNKTFRFEENISIKNQSDTFQQKIYEKNIKRNFASSIRKKLILAIMSLDDN